MLKIRGHHLLCLHGFRGLGYSPEFVSNMQAVLDQVLESPNIQIEVTNSPDAICAACPHLSSGKCTRGNGEAQISEKDANILRKASLKSGDMLTVSEVFAGIAKAFPDGLAEVCSSCSWFELGYCEDGIRKLARS